MQNVWFIIQAITLITKIIYKSFLILVRQNFQLNSYGNESCPHNFQIYFKNQEYLFDQVDFCMNSISYITQVNTLRLYKNSELVNFVGNPDSCPSRITLAFDNKTLVESVSINTAGNLIGGFGIFSLNMCVNANCLNLQPNSNNPSMTITKNLSTYHYQINNTYYWDLVGIFGSINQCGFYATSMSNFGFIFNGSFLI